MSLADEDTNSILTDKANRAFQGNVTVEVTRVISMTGTNYTYFNLCKWRHLMVKFVTNASGAIWWPNLQPIQVHSSTEINFKLF